MSKSPKIFGVLNVTPDSFSDGGKYIDVDQALKRIHLLLTQGVHFIDIGAESSRPGATPVDATTEWARLLPVLKEVQRHRLLDKVFVDTYKPEVMEQAVDLGVAGINCIQGCVDPSTLEFVASRNVQYVAMHMHGKTSQDMQQKPLKQNQVVEEVESFFKEASRQLLSSGFEPQQFMLDPGFGFGKTYGANLELLSHCIHWSSQFPLYVGFSRKSFLRHYFASDEDEVMDRVGNALEFLLIKNGVRAVRTHQARFLGALLKK